MLAMTPAATCARDTSAACALRSVAALAQRAEAARGRAQDAKLIDIVRVHVVVQEVVDLHSVVALDAVDDPIPYNVIKERGDGVARRHRDRGRARLVVRRAPERAVEHRLALGLRGLLELGRLDEPHLEASSAQRVDVGLHGLEGRLEPFSRLEPTAL